jgi:hypothetical protein
MLDEIKLMTRGEGNKDFVWFVSKEMNEAWREKYKTAFFQTDSDINLFVDIENGNYRIYFDKIMRPWTITRSSTLTKPYVVLAASGKCGSESAKAMFKILTNFFFDKMAEVEKLFAEKIPKEYIEKYFSSAKTPEVEKAISEKIEEIVSQLTVVHFSEEVGLKDNTFIFDNFRKKKNAFFSELKKITEPSNKKEYTSFVLTGKNIVERFLVNEFDHTIFSRGLCLTTGTIDGGRIEKTIKFVKSIELSSPPTKTSYTQGETFAANGCVIQINYSNGTTETKPVTDDEISGFDTQKVGTQKLTVTYEGCTTTFEVTVKSPFTTVGTTTIQNAPNGKTEEKTMETDWISKILSNPGYRRLLILSAAIILMLIVAVKSCWNRSGKNSEDKSPEQKEQQCSPQSHDSCKKSSTDTLKIKADSCKTTQDTLDIKAYSLKK